MHKAAPYRPDCRVSAEPFSQPGLGAAEFCDQHLDPRCAGFTRVCDAPRSAHPNVSIVKPVNSTLACSAGRPGRDRRRELLKRLALCSWAPAGGAEFYGATQYRDGDTTIPRPRPPLSDAAPRWPPPSAVQDSAGPSSGSPSAALWVRTGVHEPHLPFQAN